MKKKFLIFIALLVTVIVSAQDLKEIRAQYPEAVESSQIATKLNSELAGVNTPDKPELVAYKGAVLTLMAKFAKKTKDKKVFFKEGVSLIESALKTAPTNVEIRYIRLSVQENSPRFLGYHKNMEEDKKVILDNYSTVSSKELKNVIKNFVMKSENFDENEKNRV